MEVESITSVCQKMGQLLLMHKHQALTFTMERWYNRHLVIGEGTALQGVKWPAYHLLTVTGIALSYTTTMHTER